MKKMCRALSLALCLAVGAFAQKNPYKFGDIPMADMQMTIYDKDSSAVAVILGDYGKAYVSINTVNTTLNFERHVRVKILKKEGLSWADVAIPLYHSGTGEEKVSSLKAATFNLVGGKIEETRMSKDGIFKEKFNKSINMQKFTLPNVKEGSVIEYSYTVMSEFLANFPNWQFQYRIPVRKSEYVAVIPDFFEMQQYMQGYIPISAMDSKVNTYADYTEKVNYWAMNDVPAFRKEPFIANEDDYLAKINFALAYINFRGQPTREIMGSWAKLAANLNESNSFGQIISGSGFLKKQVETLVADKADANQKIAAIFDYVKTTLEWDGTKDFLADNLKDVFDRKKGTAGDINLALASMLNKAGIDVEMVLLSTRDHGFVREQYPMTRQFNYVVCRAWTGDKFVFLDATDPFVPVDVLPERCLNGQGLLVSTKSSGWVDLTTKTRARHALYAALSLSDNVLKGKVVVTHDGYEGHKAKKQLKEKGKESFLNTFASNQSFSVVESSLDEESSMATAIKQTHTVELTEYGTDGGALIYLDPFIANKIAENPFKLEAREYPVDFGSPQEETYILNLELPETYDVEELPKTSAFGLPGNAGRYIYSVSRMGNKVSITSTLLILKTLFTPEEYGNLREFYNQVVAKQAEQIVLRKKS